MIPTVETPQAAARTRRPLRKRLVHALRRGHLYLGLFLFPWAVLYGVTAFLFNHPTAFADNPAISFGNSATAGTPVERWPTAEELADFAVATLNATQKPATPYRIADRGGVKFNRDNAFAVVKADGQTVNVLLDVKHGGGTVRSTPIRPERPKVERAPFAIGRAAEPRPRNGRQNESPTPSRDGILPENPIGERFKAAVPTILERTGFPAGEVTVTSVPEVVVPIVADGKTWKATYNPLSGSVTGTPADAETPRELSTRRFLLQLHLAHGFGGEVNARWWWAVIVDAMAFTMLFWGLTGLVMWWQIKSTRKLGFVVLVLSAAAAAALGFSMHDLLTMPQ